MAYFRCGGGGAAEAELDGIIDRNITSISNDRVTSIGGYSFYNCTNLVSADFPNAISIGTYSFYNCSLLASVDFPKATSIGSYAFQQCRRLESVVFPEVASISSSAFYSCSVLARVDFPKSENVSNNCFANCSNLNVLILRKTDTICTLSNINAFTGTPFASSGTGGTLYVPQALIASYQAASNWSTILGYSNNQIKAIEGSIYE